VGLGTFPETSLGCWRDACLIVATTAACQHDICQAMGRRIGVDRVNCSASTNRVHSRMSRRTLQEVLSLTPRQGAWRRCRCATSGSDQLKAPKEPAERIETNVGRWMPTNNSDIP
jgi:hypothetical protein